MITIFVYLKKVTSASRCNHLGHTFTIHIDGVLRLPSIYTCPMVSHTLLPGFCALRECPVHINYRKKCQKCPKVSFSAPRVPKVAKTHPQCRKIVQSAKLSFVYLCLTLIDPLLQLIELLQILQVRFSAALI